MAGSRLQLLFLCYRDSGDSLLLKHNGHLSPRGVIQIQYQLKVIPILFSPALQHIYCCAVQLKALPGPGAARRAPACASLPGGFGTLPGGYGVEEAGQSRGGSAGLGAGGRCSGGPAVVPRRAAGAARSAPAGRTFRAPWKLGAPRAAGAEGGSGSRGSAARPASAPRPPPGGPARPRRGAAAATGTGSGRSSGGGKRRQRAGIFPAWRGGICSQLRGSRSVRRGWGRSLDFSSFYFIFIIDIRPPSRWAFINFGDFSKCPNFEGDPLGIG